MMKVLSRFYSLRWLGLLIIMVIAILLPWLTTNRYLVHLLTIFFIWSIPASAFNLLFGYMGYVHMALAAFFGIGAYTSALLMVKLGWSFWVTLPISVILVAFVAYVIGWSTLRTRGIYFALITLAFNIIVTTVIERGQELTGGSTGILGIPRPSIFGITFESMTSTYYLALVVLVITLFVIHRVMNSSVGRCFIAIRGNEELAASIGVDPFRYKMLCLVLSSVSAGIGGSVYACYMGHVSPVVTDFVHSFYFMIYVLIGGAGTLAGPVIGTFILVWLPEVLHVAGQIRLLVLGLVLILIIMFAPRGIMGWLRSLWRWEPAIEKGDEDVA